MLLMMNGHCGGKLQRVSVSDRREPDMQLKNYARRTLGTYNSCLPQQLCTAEPQGFRCGLRTHAVDDPSYSNRAAMQLSDDVLTLKFNDGHATEPGNAV